MPFAGAGRPFADRGSTAGRAAGSPAAGPPVRLQTGSRACRPPFEAAGAQRSDWQRAAHRNFGGASGVDPRKGCGRPLLGRQVVAHGSSGSRTRQKHRPCGTGWRRQDLAGRGDALRFRQDATHGHDARRQVVPRLRSRGDQAQVHDFHLHRPHSLQGLQDQRAGHLRPSRLHR